MLIVQYTEDTGKDIRLFSNYFQISYFNEGNTIQSDKKGDLNL